MVSTRSSYQRLNPNMSTKQVVKQKTAYFSFKSPDGEIIKRVDVKGISLISREFPESTRAHILLDLINGKTLNVRHYQLTLVYR